MLKVSVLACRWPLFLRVSCLDSKPAEAGMVQLKYDELSIGLALSYQEKVHKLQIAY